MSKLIKSGSDVSFQIPDNLKCAIADCILLHSKIENITVEILWIVERADLNRKRQISTRRGSLNTDELKKVIEALPDVETDAIWQTCKYLSDERHIIAHGVWFMMDQMKPYVVWHKWIDTNEGGCKRAVSLRANRPLP